MQPTGSKNPPRNPAPVDAAPATAQQQTPAASRGLFSSLRLAINRRNRAQDTGPLQTLSASARPLLGTTPALSPPTAVVRNVLGYLDLKSQLALSVASRAHRDVVAASHPNDRPALQEIATLRASEKSLTEQKDAMENRAFAARSAAPPSALERAAARMAGKPAPMSEEDLWNAARSLGAQASQAHAQRIEREAQFVKAVDARGVAVPHIEDLLTVEHAIGRLEAGDMQGMPWPELFDAGALMPDRRCTQNLYEASRDASGLRFRTLAASGQLVAMREHLVSIAFMGVLKGAADATPLPRQTLTVHFSSSPIPDDPSIDDPNMAQIATRRHTDRETGQVTSQEYAVVGRDRQEHVFEFTEADGSQVFYVDTFNDKAHPPGTVMDQPD